MACSQIQKTLMDIFFPPKPRSRSSAFKPVTPKSFSSMQNLYPSKSEELMNGKHSLYSKMTSKSLSTSSSSSSPSRVGTSANKGVLAVPHEEETASDSGHNSMSSLPPYRPPFRPQLGQISASMGHIEHIGSLERTSAGTVGIGALSMAPESYELSQSLEDVVKDLEERLQEKEHELWQMRRNLDESEDAIAQVSTKVQGGDYCTRSPSQNTVSPSEISSTEMTS